MIEIKHKIETEDGEVIKDEYLLIHKTTTGFKYGTCMYNTDSYLHLKKSDCIELLEKLKELNLTTND